MKIFKGLAVGASMAVLFLGAGMIGAQESVGEYHDPLGRFHMPIPNGWANASEGDIAHYISTDDAHLYALAVEADDLQTGISAALAQIIPDFDMMPMQSSEIPLPGVTWTQNLYVLEGGELLAGIGTQQGGMVYVLAIRASQAALVAATPTLNNVLLGFSIGESVSVLELLPDYVDPEAYTQREVTLVSGDFELPATLTIPNGDGPFPAVVLVHGSGPSDRDEAIGINKPFRDLALGLATQGIASLRYDKRTFAYRENLGALTGITVDGETTDDAVAAVAFLRATEGIDPAQVFVVGHSQGGMMAGRIGQESGADGVVILAGNSRPFDRVLSEQLAYIESLGIDPAGTGLVEVAAALRAIREGADPMDQFPGLAEQAGYWGSIAEVDPVADVQGLDVPVLILQGERDYQVTMEDFALWQESLADNANVTFKSYPTLTHIFIELGDVDRMAIPSDYNGSGFVAQEVVDDIAAWINNLATN